MFTGYEAQRYGIYAMAGIFGGEALTGEDVTQVRAAGGTGYLCPPAVGIGRAADRAGYLLVKARPTAAGMEFIRGSVEGRIAPAAYVNAVFEQPVIFPAEGRFGTLVQDDPFFVRRQSVIFHHSELVSV
jgi:hypothetical protein